MGAWSVYDDGNDDVQDYWQEVYELCMSKEDIKRIDELNKLAEKKCLNKKCNMYSMYVSPANQEKINKIYESLDKKILANKNLLYTNLKKKIRLHH